MVLTINGDAIVVLSQLSIATSIFFTVGVPSQTNPPH